MSKQAKKPAVEFTTYDQYLFGNATHYDLYNKLGAHLTERDGVSGVYFAVWAPNAKSVSVVGDFNGWDPACHVMTKSLEIGIWDIFVPGLTQGMLYKYCIHGYTDEVHYKTDPFASYMELRPGTASVVWNEDQSAWSDASWMKKREAFDIHKDPMVIYECQIGGWMKHPEWDNRPDGFYTYREFADAIIPYLKKLHYTHVEIMGISEYPFDGSWGYQVTGYFAPTSRYGTPDDFIYMINAFHKNGIGVLLDWVPAHFPKDECGLAMFDGTALYEHEDPRQGEHPEWGTKIFNYGRPEVKNFLIASALSWIERYHIDGLRVDAVASMLYLDYGRKDGEWVANKYGDNKNLEAIEFFRHINTVIMGRNKGTVMIAEESTAWPGITEMAEYGGLNFAMKWNMGWMNDFLEYMKLDPYFRKFNHHKLTFSTSYAQSEKFVLVLSHDEVVHLKCSMLEKMPGIYEDKYSNLRAAYTYMCGHQGKKLLFMGQEFGQRREWSEESELDWFLLDEPLHKQLLDYVGELWKIYGKYPALHATDFDGRGFEWINADDADRSIYSFVRRDLEGGELLFVLNMCPVERPDYAVGVPGEGKYKLLLNSMDPKFGGNAEIKQKTYETKPWECDGRPNRLEVGLPAYGCLIFEKVKEKAPAKKPAPKKAAGKAKK